MKKTDAPLPAPARSAHFAVECTSLDVLLDLLAVAKLHGVRAQVGEALLVQPIKRYKKRAAPADTPSKPKRHKSAIAVRVAKEPPNGLTAKEQKVLGAIRAEFGTEPFQKGLAKRVVMRRLRTKSCTSHITRLMDKHALVPAVNGSATHG